MGKRSVIVVASGEDMPLTPLGVLHRLNFAARGTARATDGLSHDGLAVPALVSFGSIPDRGIDKGKAVRSEFNHPFSQNQSALPEVRRR